VPLSEEELRLLEQMERALVAEDPKLASALRGTTLRRHARRRMLAGALVFVVGIAVLMTGAITQLTIVGIVGFVVMLGSAYLMLVSWRGSSQAAAEPPRSPGAAEPGLTVIQGGKSAKASKRPKARKSASMMERFEERWRRRRDQNGGSF
jgi:hypothetical protein